MKVVSNNICPSCNKIIDKNSKFCTNCGTEIAKTTIIPELKCSKCNNVIKEGTKYCVICGTPINNTSNQEKTVVNEIDTNKLTYYNMSEDQIITSIIESEITKSGETINITTPTIEKKKNIFTLTYIIILFICLSLRYFHISGIVNFILLVVSIIYIKLVKKYNIVKFLKKEIKSRPDEKISYIVATVISGKIPNIKYKVIRVTGIILGIILPIIIFYEPRIIYEKQDNNYVIRFYTIGSIKNDKIVKIPSKYKGKKVVGIRGNVFSNVDTIEEIILPNTIEEIRGETFMNASNLEKINLPTKITEIKGSTFENCSSLKEIVIPDGVTRIGGSAFRNCTSLEKVKIPISVKEIGSSAFRNTGLTKVCYSKNTIINSRAFKDNNIIIRYYQENNCESEYGSYYE